MTGYRKPPIMAGTAEVEGRLVPTGHSLVRRKKLEAAALALGAGL